MKEIAGRRIETAANIFIIVVSVLGSIALARNLIPGMHKEKNSAFRGVPSQPAKKTVSMNGLAPPVGSSILLPGVAWRANERTLLLVLSTDCHFCSEGASFYRRVANEASPKRIGVIAAFPQDTGTGKRFLNDLIIPITNIVQTSLDAIHVKGTPTLILLDKKGLVMQTWLGRLPPELEQEVMDSMRL